MAASDRMKRRDVLLAIVSLCADKPEFGRTSLQKVAFFVGEDAHLDLGHRAHYYGPFSDVIESEVEAIVLSGLVDEKVRSLSFVGASGHVGKRYEYELTDEGEERVEQLREAYQDEFEQLETFIARLTEAAGSLDQGILSAAAKTFFIAKRENRALTLPEIRALGTQLGWNLTPARLKRVVCVLQELGLIQVSSS